MSLQQVSYNEIAALNGYRNRGLAAAALSEMYLKTKKLGATHMTGGNNAFYKKIGYMSAVKWTYWQKG